MSTGWTCGWGEYQYSLNNNIPLVVLPNFQLSFYPSDCILPILDHIFVKFSVFQRFNNYSQCMPEILINFIKFSELDFNIPTSYDRSYNK